MTEAPAQPVERCAVLLAPEFAMYDATVVIDALRIANKHLAVGGYACETVTLDGGAVRACNGMRITADRPIGQSARYGTVFVVSAFEPERAADPRLLSWLRRLARSGARIGGVNTGAVLMAMAGLLNGRAATVHFEALVAFREAFPDVEVIDHIYMISPSRFTCAGGAAIFDLLFALLALDHGERLARQVAQDLVHGQIRAASDDQRITLDHRWNDRQPRLAQALSMMEDNLEDPLPLASLTQRIGLTRGTLERLFREHLGTTPMRHYLDMRLVKARHLLLNSSFPLGEVGLACGFSSPAAFSRAFRRRYGQAPSQCRRLSRAH